MGARKDDVHDGVPEPNGPAERLVPAGVSNGYHRADAVEFVHARSTSAETSLAGVRGMRAGMGHDRARIARSVFDIG